jgi:hypothetical protein
MTVNRNFPTPRIISRPLGRLSRKIRRLLGGEEAALRPFLSSIFDYLDRFMPELLTHADGYEVYELIARAIQRETGRHASAAEVRFVTRLYNPIIAAEKVFVP